MTAPYVPHESSPYLKRILIPFWILRGIVLVIGLGLYSLALAALIAFNDHFEDFERESGENINLPGQRAVAGTIVGLFIVSIAFEVVCFVKRGRRTLSPLFFLVVNVLVAAFMIFIFVLTMLSERTPARVGVAIAELAVFLGSLVYSAVIYHKFRRGRLTPDIEHIKASQYAPQ